MRDAHQEHKGTSSVVKAEVFALLMLLGCGGGYRLLAAQYARAFESTPIPRGSLGSMTLQCGPWSGRDVPLSEYIVRATQTDDHINRLYTDSSGRQVWLFVACGGRLRDLMPHRPEVCYPGAGWALRESYETSISSSAGPIGCRVHHFAQSGLEAQQATVLNYYIVNGAFCPDVSLLRFKSAKLSNTAGYSVQVQAAAFGSDPAAGEAAVTQFSSAAAPLISSVIENVVQHTPAHQARNN
jgi:EpsI family protein